MANARMRDGCGASGDEFSVARKNFPAVTARAKRRKIFPGHGKKDRAGNVAGGRRSRHCTAWRALHAGTGFALSFSGCNREDRTVQDNNPASSAARELKAAARDALRMGSQWAHTALHWIDERNHDMTNRNREDELRGRAQRNRAASGHGSGEGDYRASQPYESQGRASPASGQSSVLGGRQGRDRDIQADPGWRLGQQHAGREGSYPQPESSIDETSQRGDYARGSGYGSSGYVSSGSQRGSGRNLYGASQGRGQDYGMGGRSGGYGAGSEGFDDQDFAQDYSQGSSHFGSQGFGAQGSQGVYGPQGFGSQGGIGAHPAEYGLGAGYGSSGGYGREAYGTGQYAQGSSTSYRGMGPRNYTRSDERIREDLNERLTDAHDIDATGLSVEVNNGVATLSGSVGQRWMKHRAEDLAESCSGVRDVNNQIRVASPSDWQSGSQRSSAHAGSGASSNPASGTGLGSSSGQASATQPRIPQSSMGQSGAPQSSASSAGTPTGTTTGGNGGSSTSGPGSRSSGSTLS